MKDVRVEAKNIGSSVVAEQATIGAMQGQVKDEAAELNRLLALLLEQSQQLGSSSISLTPETVSALAAEIQAGITQVRDTQNGERRKQVIAHTLQRVKEIAGGVADTLQTVFQIASLVGVK